MNELTNYFALIGASAPILYGIYRYVWKPIVRKHHELVAFFNDAKQVHQIVRYEFKPNGGLSLRDSINRIETRQVAFEARNRAMLNYSGLALFESDAAGRCIWVNRNYLRMVDRSQDDVMGWGWENSVHPDDRDAVSSGWSSAIKQGREFISDYRMLSVDGQIITVHCEAMPLKQQNGTVTGYFGSIRIRE